MVSIKTEVLEFSTSANNEIIDITKDISEFIYKSGMNQGHVTVTCIGSTGGISTIEYEPGLIKDIPELFDALIPQKNYHHDLTWHDGNGHSHLRSFLTKTSMTFIFKNRKLLIGTWQQIVFLEFDNKPRSRKVAIQIIGE